MILVRTDQTIEDGITKPLIVLKKIFDKPLLEVIANVKEMMNELCSKITLKDTESGHLIELQWVGGQAVGHYVLDLFDFEKEFFT